MNKFQLKFDSLNIDSDHKSSFIFLINLNVFVFNIIYFESLEKKIQLNSMNLKSKSFGHPMNCILFIIF